MSDLTRFRDCEVPGCDKSVKARRVCSAHYSRWRRTGDAGEAATAPKTRRTPAGLTLAERLVALAPEKGETGCWEWTAYRHQGYGYLTIEGKNRRAHRVAYEVFVGPIPAGLTLDHLCRNRACINPAHLEPVTALVNNRRSMSPSAVNRRKGACSLGHRFTEGNTYIAPDGTRSCRTCRNAASAAYKARQREDSLG